MAAGDGETAALRAEVAALRLRVQELERDNQRLAKIASSCSCGSKEENIASSPVASASLYGSDQEVQQNGKSHESRTSGHDVSFPFDHMATSTENEVPCSGNAGGHGLPKNSSKCANRTGHQVGIVSHCPKQLVALQVMYFGQRFYGFASEAHTEPTVESEIFKALERAKLLVGSRKESCYSRCGRTDKGVSATGQVISLYLRSNIKDAGGNVLDERSEIDYVKVLNRILPRDIRVIGWCPVAADFLARFSCLGREYKYLFWKGSLDISVMQKAASKFIGEHDFRNFCKMDAVNVSNYRRKITDFNISAYDQRSNNDELWAMTIKGSAFLWHQVRCMVAVLFLIGQGLESPCVHELSILGPYTCMDDSLRLDWWKFKDLMQDSLESLMQVYKCMLNSQVHGSRWNIHVVDSLLDITKTPRKPQYKMAPELPLILRSCLFDKVNFMCSSDASQALIEHLKDEYHQYMLQAAIFHEALSCLSFTERNSFQPHQKKRNHILLMSRQTEPSYDERVAKVKTKSTDSM